MTGAVVPPGGEGADVGIPKFWLTCLQNNDATEELISEKDIKVLEHLVDITCEFVEPANDADADPEDEEAAGAGDLYGFVLHFVFSANEFFDHPELTKKYMFSDDEQTVLVAAEGTDIHWKSGAYT